DKGVNVKMHAILSTECGTEYSGLDLDSRQARGGENRLFDFQARHVGNGEEHARAEIRVDDGLESELQFLQRYSRRMIRGTALEIGIVSRQEQRRALAVSGRTGKDHGDIGVEALKKSGATLSCSSSGRRSARRRHRFSGCSIKLVGERWLEGAAVWSWSRARYRPSRCRIQLISERWYGHASIRSRDARASARRDPAILTCSAPVRGHWLCEHGDMPTCDAHQSENLRLKVHSNLQIELGAHAGTQAVPVDVRPAIRKDASSRFLRSARTLAP